MNHTVKTKMDFNMKKSIFNEMSRFKGEIFERKSSSLNLDFTVLGRRAAKREEEESRIEPKEATYRIYRGCESSQSCTIR